MSTVLTLSDETLTTVALQQSEDLRDMQRQDYPVTADLIASNDPWDGGDTLTVPWDVENHSNPRRLQSGYERYDETVRPTLKPGIVTPAFVAQPILISLVDETKTGGKGKIIDLVKQRTENVERHQDADLQAVAFRGPAASGSWAGRAAYADWNTFNGVDSITGFLEAVASGTNMLHTVSKASYPATTHPGFHNVYRDSADAAGTNLLNDMYRIGIILQTRGAPIVARENKWYVGENPAVWLKRALRPQERYESQSSLDDGARPVLTFMGVGIIPCIDMPTNGASSATSPVSAILINWARGAKMRMYPAWSRKMLPFAPVPGTVGVRAALKLVGGQIVCPQPGLCALIERAEVY